MDTVQVFEERLRRFPFACDSRAAERLARYQSLLLEWNEKINLTGDASLEATLDRHFMDSLAPLATEGLFPKDARVIDVGTGAGFPGLPLAIARPDLSVLLLDSLGKRVAFLDAVIAELGLTNVQTLHARAEDGARNPACRERFDVAAARAVAAAPVLMELLLPFVRVGGRALCYKGPSAEEEIGAASRAACLLGGSAVRSVPAVLPGQPDWQHCVLVCNKKAGTPAEFPRKAGTPAKMPLG
ncbi:MAG TPA: 16S rRNA (guanine(527)-N(7))-methyltransferase RsmG [Candidatus Limiplasma sp.]|nr:16S rRNA (guanine(527)-N(7))-methyltransferase RsmG [Candidatus Limiplasma sp.]HPS81125.1 16S rRNA (guanine(527)-N(7))-methyltransferase RsmG [Candidatus Limiplasma sp.]